MLPQGYPVATDKFLVPARQFVEVLAALGDEHSVKLEGDEGKVRIAADGTRYELDTLPAEEYPVRPPKETEDSWLLELDGQDLKGALQDVAVAMESQEYRQGLNGILWTVASDGVLELTATDTFRLADRAVAATPLVYPSEEFARAIMHRSTVALLVKLLDKAKAVRVGFGKTEIRGQFSVSIDQVTELIADAVDSYYPHKNQVAKQEHEHRVSFDTEPVVKQLRKLVKVAAENAERIVIEFDPDNTIAKAKSKGFGTVSVNLPIEYSGEPFRLGLNVRYLLEGLARMQFLTILSWNSKDKPVSFTSGAYEYVQMPLVLRGEE